MSRKDTDTPEGIATEHGGFRQPSYSAHEGLTNESKRRILSIALYSERQR